jgi:hypothetical protein
MRISYGPFTATKINPGQSTLPGLLQVVASTVGSCDPGGVGVSGDGGMPPGLGRCHYTYISPSEHHVSSHIVGFVASREHVRCSGPREFPFLCVFHTLILMRIMLVIPAMRAM